MKKFIVEIESEHNSQAFVMESESMEDAIKLLKESELNCVRIGKLKDDYNGVIRNPKFFKR